MAKIRNKIKLKIIRVTITIIIANLIFVSCASPCNDTKETDKISDAENFLGEEIIINDDKWEENNNAIITSDETDAETTEMKYVDKSQNIDKIYVYHRGFGQIYPEYKIDLKEKKFWKYNTGWGLGNDYDYIPRDRTSENEGYTFICDLNYEKIEEFLNESVKYGLTLWEAEYIDENVIDGHQWGMIIIYSDSTSLNIHGSNKYPDTYNEMRDAFLNLTGEKVL